MNTCAVCGKQDFAYSHVLWRDLILDWQLSPQESEYINRQQGFHCTSCGNNLRSMALAAAITSQYSFKGPLAEFVVSVAAKKIRVLEINEAGNLTPILSKLPQHTIASYPETDIHNLPFADGSFELVIHSDTLEHIANPIAGLAECRRVLSPGGRCIYTIPIIVDRLTRARDGLKPSYHGSESENREGLMVRTEFGSDAWTFVLRAGFSAVTMHAIEYPAGIAVVAVR